MILSIIASGASKLRAGNFRVWNPGHDNRNQSCPKRRTTDTLTQAKGQRSSARPKADGNTTSFPLIANAWGAANGTGSSTVPGGRSRRPRR